MRADARNVELAGLESQLRRRRVGDDRGVDRADRNAGHPIRMQIMLCERLVSPDVIGTQRPAARYARQLAYYEYSVLGIRWRQSRIQSKRIIGRNAQSGIV